MTCHAIKAAQFEELVKDHSIVFIDFWAAWCAPCKHFSAVYEHVSELFPSIKFVKVNIEEEQAFAESFEIRSIPHLLVIKDGIVIYSNAGSMPESMLKDLAQQAIAVDVSGIHEELGS